MNNQQKTKNERLDTIFSALEKNGGWMTQDDISLALGEDVSSSKVMQYLNTLTTEGKVISRRKEGSDGYFEYSANLMYSAGSVINNLWRK